MKNKYTRNSDYFKQINSKKKAYFLGLLYADGNIHKNLKRFRLKLIEPDKHLLEALAKDMEYTGGLYFSKCSDIGNFDLWSLEINDAEIVKDLLNLGLYPNKSLTIKFPDFLEEKYLLPFIAGYFDGDGGICHSDKNPNHITLNFCVSYDFGEKFKNILFEKYKTHSTLFKSQNKIWKISISGMVQCMNFLKLIYDSTPVKMERKYKKYIEINKCHKNTAAKVLAKKTSKYRGVYFVTAKKRYMSFVKDGGKLIRFGTFKNETDAAIAYNEGIEKLKINRLKNII